MHQYVFKVVRSSGSRAHTYIWRELMSCQASQHNGLKMLLLTTELLENSIEKRESNILYATEKEKEKR